MFEIEVPVLVENPDNLPFYATPGAAGADIRANVKEPVIIEPGCSALIPTGVRVEIPQGYEIQVRPRSGLALKNQITVLNTPGTIDSDYRGEIQVILINHGKKTFVVEPQMRIAQIVFASVVQAKFCIKESIAGSGRGESGFGHTGIA